jgi:hypothetical protein
VDRQSALHRLVHSERPQAGADLLVDRLAELWLRRYAMLNLQKDWLDVWNVLVGERLDVTDTGDAFVLDA